MNRAEPKNLARDAFNRAGIKNDKAQHFIVGAGVVLPLALAGYAKTGLIVAIIAGVVIEIVDYFDDNPNSVPSFLDALATIAGGIVAYYLLT
jgi:hypothetical protein